MSIIHLPVLRDDEPSAADLVAIELEWPLIAAELDLLDAQITQLSTGPNMSDIDRRRVRRAEHRVLAVTRRLRDLDGTRAAPCGCPGNVVTSTLSGGGEQCGACGSTWDRHDTIVTFYAYEIGGAA
ncbi:DUF6284 family protein [Kribbella sp. NPDC058245]|uniref:DUF6284 family protein n=1 Tax=Kribbella sp. NPDC058245 TaxID=3346399 RepID=UPI0036EF77DA